MMWSFAGIDPDGWLYIFSKRWNGSHLNSGDLGAIQLFRIRPGQFRAGNFGTQQNWAYLNRTWQWTTEVPPSIISSGNNIGEFSVKRFPPGNRVRPFPGKHSGSTYCMSYFDATANAIRTRTASRPDRIWSAPKTQLTGPQAPHLYGGYIHPGSASATSLTLIVSRWDGTVGSAPYCATQFDGISP
jgi:D-arabinan endo alpha-(1,5)-arabinofuranosidase